MKIEEKYPDSEPCSCEECKAACSRPCWPTPAEAERLIDAGFGDQLMLDEWVANDSVPDGSLVLCPANPGHQGKHAPFDPQKGCVMQASGLCKLHDLGLKPIEGRHYYHGKSSGDVHRAVAIEWDTDHGRSIAERWKAEVGLEGDGDYDSLEVIGEMFEMFSRL